MPASQTETIFQGLEVTVEPVTEPDPVYWTDQSPEFRIQLHNSEDSKYEWTGGSELTINIEIDGDLIHAETIEFGPLEYGEEETQVFESNVLAYEGHGVVSVDSGGAVNTGSEDRAKLQPGGHSFNPVYSFSVWDKSHYTSTVRRPRQLQLALLTTSVVLIIFAAVQIYLST